ncbi:MAG: 1-acyl-sn-glycerol-3-phosphate acyltransferase [Spirochaetia bacterium]|nr:1-acyl-sn-glycerol-3-phosphate acyltransferase [Spirochaetia bacterium]
MEGVFEAEKDSFQKIKAFAKPFLDWMVDIQQEGIENVPREGGCILVGNHRSDMDPFVVASVVPRYISWIAAEYTQRIPVFKNLIRETGVIPMQIDGNVSVASIKKTMSVLKSGEILGIFPEGHDYMVKNNFSGPMVKFHEGFAIFALRGKVPIVPFALIPVEEDLETIPVPSYVRSLFGLPEEVCKIPHRVNYKKVRIEFCKPIRYEDFVNSADKEKLLVHTVRERMTEKLRAHGLA